ncbi:M3 family oligoendopeptidase [Luteibacter flocculans]|uniref:M3 family oligoendopeptidase n=1 Tax=Luteibacter flocculans TaxID=2780091 RepID=A0ABY4T5M7_9GAMM|nr:M3 family metallopeptidase [Luteibacter flocculans]URL60206.1 M3 family oligoendopeptidase [Luteibacter flocculans]
MKTFIPFVLLAVLVAPVHAEDRRIDPRLWFASPAAEETDRTTLLTDVAALPVLDDPTPGALLDYLHRAERLLERTQRHAAWLHLRTAQDIDDHAAAESRRAVGDAGDTVVERTRQTLRKIGGDGFAKDVAALPALARYHWLLERAVRALPHELPDAQQSILDTLTDQDSQTFWNIYQKTRRATAYGHVHTSHGDLDVGKDADKLASDPDRRVREQAWKLRQDALAAQEETYASILVGIVRLNDRVAKLQHFNDAPEAAYFARLFTRADVDATAKAVEAHAPLLQAYQRLRAEHVAHALGIEQAHSWDLAMPTSGFEPPAFDDAQMRRVIPESLAPLGRDYVAHFRALLDPANKRTDLATVRGTREDDAFSLAAPGSPGALFLGVWKPTVKEASVVAHEGGHAIHSQLMDERGVSPFLNHGPSWMHEAIAILNEMLFYEYLYRHTDDPAAKAYYLQAQLDEMTFEIFTSAEEAQWEEGIYDGVVAGKIRGAGDMDALTLDITRRFEIWPSIDPSLAHAWIGKRLMFEDPLYLANYLYAGLWATRMFDMARKDPADFQKRYAALMAEGFDAAPDQLLARFFGKPLTPPDLVDADMVVIQEKVDALAQLYRRLPGPPSSQR